MRMMWMCMRIHDQDEDNAYDGDTFDIDDDDLNYDVQHWKWQGGGMADICHQLCWCNLFAQCKKCLLSHVLL